MLNSLSDTRRGRIWPSSPVPCPRQSWRRLDCRRKLHSPKAGRRASRRLSHYLSRSRLRLPPLSEPRTRPCRDTTAKKLEGAAFFDVRITEADAVDFEID